MAAERDLELLDDYISNRMDAEGKTAFETKMKNDPALRNEFELQQEFVRGIKKARIAELKSMMSNIPVPPVQPGATAIAGKVVLWTAVVALVGTGIYFYLDNSETDTRTTTEVPIQQVPEKETATTEKPKEPAPTDDSAVVPDEPSSDGKQPIKKPDPVKAKDQSTEPVTPAQPKIEVFDPTEERLDEQPLSVDLEENRRPDNVPSIEVQIDSNNKKYNFHYQFRDDKLFLYGPFEKNLYEILEFFSDEKRTIFLYHNEQYFLLRDENEKLKPLDPIRDPALLKKLKEYRQ